MENIFLPGFIYLLFIISFPFVTWSGSAFAFLVIFYLPIFILLAVITLRKYQEIGNTGNKWLLLLGSVYAVACLLMRGDRWSSFCFQQECQGIERLLSIIFGKPVFFIPEIMGEFLAGKAMFLYLLFFVLSVVFVVKKSKSNKIEGNLAAQSSMADNP